MTDTQQHDAPQATQIDAPATLSRTGLAMEGTAFVPTSQPFTRDGQPVRRFLKDLIAVGVYRHPSQKWTLDVTPERLDAWVGSFQQMRSNGVDVEVVVDHRGDAEATLGYLVEMFRWGDKLYGVHELVGEKAIALAGRVKNVSVLIEKDFIDGKGRKYGEAITHSSLVQRPIVPQQQGFLPIAASQGDAQPTPVLVLSAPDTDGPGQRQDLPSCVRTKIEGLEDENKQLQEKVAELTARIEAAKPAQQPQRLAASAVDAELLDSLAEGAEERIDALVGKGRLTPAAADRLKDLLIGKPGSRNAYALSRKVSGTAESIVRGVAAVLEQNHPLELTERTAGQCVALQRIEPGAQASDHSPQTTREMIEMAAGAKGAR